MNKKAFGKEKKEKLAERKLFKMRKQLFNSEKGRPSVSYKNEPGLKKLRQTLTPEEPNPSLKRLMKQCRVKVDY